MKIKCKDKYITDYVIQFTWSGSARQAARMLEFTVVSSIIDKNIHSIEVKLGDDVVLYDDSGEVLFAGTVNARERSSNKEEVNYIAYDPLNRLLKSKATYQFRNTTAERITKAVCEDLKIPTGDIEVTNIAINKLFAEEESFYSIIMMAYTKANQVNGKKYMPIMKNNRLCVIEKGKLIEGFVLQEEYNIQESTYTEDINSMVNKVKIYNDQQAQTGEVKKQEWMDVYGIFQSVYKKESGVNEKLAARNMLTGINQEASLEALGNTKCIAGYAVKVKDTATGLMGKFWIESDSHKWSDGIYTMSLDLSFKNIMDTIEVEGSTRSLVTDDTLVWVSAAGTKFHLKKTCSSLNNPKQIKAISAKTLKKTACANCIGGN